MVSVYVSYAWKEEEQNRLVDKLENACAARGIELRCDKTSIGYGDSIRQFMDEIGAGRHVVLVLSEAYFKSDYCMYELRQIYENKAFRQRVNPIVLSGTRFHKAIERIPYIKHWEKEIADLQTALNGLGDPKYTLELRKDLDGYAECRRLVVELQSTLADMNTRARKFISAPISPPCSTKYCPSQRRHPLRTHSACRSPTRSARSWPAVAASPTRCRPRCAMPGSNPPPTWRPVCVRLTRSKPSKTCSFLRRKVRWQCSIHDSQSSSTHGASPSRFSPG
jgi:hypothetical protein